MLLPEVESPLKSKPRETTRSKRRMTQIIATSPGVGIRPRCCGRNRVPPTVIDGKSGIYGWTRVAFLSRIP